MNKTLRLGTVGGLKLMAKGNAVVGSLMLWVLLAAAAVVWLDLGWATAVFGGFIALLLHWGGELWHNLGHAWAARRTGYPMSGVMAVWILAGSLYPPDEGELPAHVHIQRALGGPISSALLTVVAGLLSWGLRPLGGLIWYLSLFFFLDNLLVFTLGAFLPLGFTDGSTLLRYARR